MAPKRSYKSTRFALFDYEAGESSVSFWSPRCPHTGPQCGPAEIHGCFISGVLREISGKNVVIPALFSGFVAVCRQIKCFTKHQFCDRSQNRCNSEMQNCCQERKPSRRSEKLLRGFSNYIRREKMVAAYRLCWREGKESCEVAYSRKSYWRSAHHVVDGADDAGDNEEGKKI